MEQGWQEQGWGGHEKGRRHLGRGQLDGWGDLLIARINGLPRRQREGTEHGRGESTGEDSGHFSHLQPDGVERGPLSCVAVSCVARTVDPTEGGGAGKKAADLLPGSSGY